MAEASETAPPAPSRPGLDYQDLDFKDHPTPIRLSEILRRTVDLTGRAASWCFIPLIVITVFDVTARKLVWIQLWLIENFGTMFESTKLQELEWHFHTALFTLVLGYGYIWNTHVRVDLVREHLHFRKKAWLEFIGVTIFLFPFTACVIYFASIYAYDSWAVGEISASTVGLSHRWIIKSVLVVGLVMAMVGGVAVWLQLAIVLFGSTERRFRLMTLEWPEEEGSTIEGKERLDLSKARDELVARAKERGHISADHPD